MTWAYEQGYAVRRLFVDLEADAALYPDTMADRYGAWGRLLGLFQLIHDGAGPDFMHQRRGKLFDPETFPFLLGRFDADDQPDVLPVSDKCIYDVLHQLLMLGGERLSYKTLDVEQIGSVYETVMGFTVMVVAASYEVDAYLMAKDGLNSSIATCPHCATEAYVENGETSICFACGESVAGECERCGTGIDVHEYNYDYEGLCSYCAHMAEKYLRD